MIKGLLAITATLLVTGSYIPQLIKAYTTKSMKDVSLLFLLIIVAGIICWVAYGIVLGDLTFVISNSVILVFSVTLIGMKLYYDRKTPA